jgi:hypothetical protein
MRLLLTLATATLLTATHAQYGSFSAAPVKAAKAHTTLVVLDGGNTPYDRAIMDAVKNHWTFSGAYEFVTLAELGSQPVMPDRTYLLRTSKVDPVKFEGTFLTLVQGWKPKKGDQWQVKDGAFTGIPDAQELAFILVDAKAVNEPATAAMLTLYVKHLQDYLKLVETGKITDKATADRTYASRNRLVRDTELWIATDHLDKSLPDAAKVQEHYTSPVKLTSPAEVMAAVEKQDRSVTVSDVVITVGDHRNKHCFKRIFNAGTGELMYQGDDQAIFGKKEGIIDQDLKNVTRAR